MKKKKTVGVIGLGYVGLPLILNISKYHKIFNIIGFDTNEKKINLLNKKKSYLFNIKHKFISNLIQRKVFFTKDYYYVRNCDYIILCLPTPLKKNKNPDLSYVKNSINLILPNLRDNQTIILESTTYPGTTNQEIIQRIKNETNYDLGNNIFVCYSPEREDPGNKKFKTKNIPKLIAGHTKKCLLAGLSLYKIIFKKVVPIQKIETAEFSKLLENIYRSVNIALVNEMKIIADKMKLNIHECIKAASTKPFGYKAFHPGPGFGGHCIPIDPFYMAWISKKYGYDPMFIKHSGYINRYIPKWICQKISTIVKKKNPKILIMGLSYKKNVDDLRESPAIEIINILENKNCIISYHDKFINEFFFKKKNFNKKYKSINLNSKNIKSNDAVILVTDHTNVNYDLLQKNAKVIIDTRNVYKKKYKNVIVA